ncbi:MAG: hypothetical protein ACREPA_07940 [Candidatus Dormibacteraceae bacterium]
MARKQKRKGRDRKRHPAPGAVAPAAPRGEAGAANGPSAAQPLVRAVEMKLAPPATGKRRAGRVVLESADPAIPFDQVPHFTSDLRRIGLTMGVMVVLLVIGSFFIPVAIR